MNALEKQFAQTVAEHKSTIYTVCYMFSQDADEVNDLFQEVLVNLWKGFDKFEHRSDIRTWIYRVALNTCISLDREETCGRSPAHDGHQPLRRPRRGHQASGHAPQAHLQTPALRPRDCPALAREPPL